MICSHNYTMVLTLVCGFFIGQKDTITIISDGSDGDRSNDTIKVEEPPSKKSEANFSYIFFYCVCASAQKYCSCLCFSFSPSLQIFGRAARRFFCVCYRGY